MTNRMWVDSRVLFSDLQSFDWTNPSHSNLSPFICVQLQKRDNSKWKQWNERFNEKKRRFNGKKYRFNGKMNEHQRKKSTKKNSHPFWYIFYRFFSTIFNVKLLSWKMKHAKRTVLHLGLCVKIAINDRVHGNLWRF